MTRTDATEHLVDELRRPAAYSRPVDEVGFLQTHISLLFFAGERVYKVKKPVDLGFLDFTTLERRRHFCEEEVRLNRRLAPDVYLGVVPITRDADGHLVVGGEGEPVEWAVEMVRLPEKRMLSSLLERGEIDNERMNSMVSLLAEFHAHSATGADVDRYGSPEAIRANIEQNFEPLRPFVAAPDAPSEAQRGRASASASSAATDARVRVLSPSQYAFLRARALDFLDEQRDLVERRVVEHRIRDGHGDLHAGNICFTDGGIVAYDCIEFSAQFRCGDVASELAFLAMDLDDRGYPGFSRYLVQRYAELTRDADLARLVDFYKGYRAVVRGKVAALTASDPAVATERRAELVREAMRYLQLAAGYELPPALVLMCGLPACGKSWLAKRLVRPLRGVVLHSDVRRKVLAGLTPTTRVREDYGAGLYSADDKDRTYRSLLKDALESVRAGRSVIVDATFAQRAHRAPFVDAATRLELPWYLVHVTAPEDVTRARLEQREREGRGASDAGLDVYLRARESFEPPLEVPQEHVLEVESGRGGPEEQGSLLIDRMIALRPDAAERGVAAE